LESPTVTGTLTATGTVEASNLTRGGSQVYSRDNILGTVSQSGGVPTGAIIERGSNANGEFVKYADGTMICTHSFSIASTGNPVWTFPSTFSSGVDTFIGGTPENGVNARVFTSRAPTNTTVEVFVWNTSNVRAGQATRLTAIGRWF
jgi:hypothetical protein